MNMNDLITGYYKRILESASKEEVNKIVSEINSLTYANNGEKISYEHKLKITTGILLLHKNKFDYIEERAIPELDYSKYIVLEHSSNDEILRLCSLVHEEISKQKGEKK